MIKGIQLLRALAALAVVYYHYGFHNLVTGGFGVDIFFIISGFIIAYVVNKDTSLFMVKRVLRVSPLYFLATLFSLCLALLKPEWFRNTVVNSEAIVKSFLYIPYRIGESGPILSLGWSLNYEMLFYLATFICILFVKRKSLVVPACAALIVIFLSLLQFFDSNNYIIFFFRDGLLPEFVYGLGLYYFWKFYEQRKSEIISLFMIIAGIAAFGFIVYCDITKQFDNLSRNIVKGIPALLFVNVFLQLESKINAKNVLVKFGLKLGDASYAMYLFHPFIIFFLLRVVYPKIPGVAGNMAMELACLAAALALVSLVSMLIYSLVDKPLNSMFKRVLSKYDGSVNSNTNAKI